MRKLHALLLVALFLTSSLIVIGNPVSGAADQNTWVEKAPMQVARSGLGVAAVNGKIYAIGGTTASGFTPSGHGAYAYGYNVGGVSTNEEYDPETDTWTNKASMPTPRLAFGIAVYKNKIYCIGGQANISFTGINEVYDPATDTWETKAPMPTPRGWVKANAVNGKIYLMGGYGLSFSSDSSKFNEVYDPETDSWTTKTPSPDVPINSNNLASAVFDNKIFLFGGLTQDKHYQLNQIYNTETDTWSAGSYPPSSIGGGAAASTTGAFAPKRIYAMGVSAGLGTDAPLRTNRVYAPKIDSWSAYADMPEIRYNFGIAVVDDTLYVIGGHTYNSLAGGPYAPVAWNEQYVPLRYGTPDPSYVPPDLTPPEIAVLSPENLTYYTVDVVLNFTVNETASSMRVMLDGEVFEVSENTTLTGFTYGSHNLTIYATDAADNTGSSETVNFTIAKEPEPFPTMLVAAASVASIAVIVVGLLVYFKRYKRKDTVIQGNV
jgi:N-acetylneuraminic acid mutarotase